MPRKVAARKGPRRSVLRPDTTLAPAGGADGGEVYVGGLPACCLRSFKEAVVRLAPDDGEGRSAGHRCPECGRGWVVTGTLDGRVAGRFAVRGGGRSGERAPGGSGSAA